jgi:hypothetical protein
VGDKHSRVCALVLAAGRGGPHEREKVSRHTDGAFSSADDASNELAELVAQFRGLFVPGIQYEHGAIAYGHGAFSRWAKTLMMIQASISLAVLVLLAARAVNIL